MNASEAAPTSYTELAHVLDSLPLLIREARRARGLSLRSAAALIGTNASTIARIEQGEAFNTSTAGPILRWLDARDTAARAESSQP
jgi:transcriptional regulator with XRE-family HTH domain